MVVATVSLTILDVAVGVHQFPKFDDETELIFEKIRAHKFFSTTKNPTITPNLFGNVTVSLPLAEQSVKMSDKCIRQRAKENRNK